MAEELMYFKKDADSLKMIDRDEYEQLALKLDEQ